jgi:hypothetical protein
MDLVPPHGQTLHGQEKDALIGANGALDCRQSR